MGRRQARPMPPPTRPAHANLLQVLILDILKVGQAGNVEVVAEPQEILLQLHLGQQLQQPACALLRLHAAAPQPLRGEKNGSGTVGCRQVTGDPASALGSPTSYYVLWGRTHTTFLLP